MSQYLILVIGVSICAILWFMYQVKSYVGGTLEQGKDQMVMDQVYIIVIGALITGWGLGVAMMLALNAPR